MSLFVEVIRVAPPGFDHTGEQPAYRLEGEFASLDDANAAAVEHISELKLPPGSAHYRVYDSGGWLVVSTEDRSG